MGTFTFPGLLKIKGVRKPATKARKMISPFTGQEITVAAKPASRAVKVQPLSGLKRMVEWVRTGEGSTVALCGENAMVFLLACHRSSGTVKVQETVWTRKKKRT